LAECPWLEEFLPSQIVPALAGENYGDHPPITPTFLIPTELSEEEEMVYEYGEDYI